MKKDSTLQTLLDKLQLRYPNKLPPVGTDINELYYMQGQLDVVTYIITTIQQEKDSAITEIK